MEKVQIDNEVRKFDMLRSAHQNQQYEIRTQVRDLPALIENSKECHAGLLEDIATRNAHGGEFTMKVDGREFSGKNAREEAGKALIQFITASLWEGSRELKLKRLGDYKGFAIMSSFSGREGETPKLYRLDHDAEGEKSRCERMEKALADYQEQLNRPFEHEDRLRELCARQQEINRQLDLDKSDSQVVANDNTQQDEPATGTFVERLAASRIARGQAKDLGVVA